MSVRVLYDVIQMMIQAPKSLDESVEQRMREDIAKDALEHGMDEQDTEVCLWIEGFEVFARATAGSKEVQRSGLIHRILADIRAEAESGIRAEEDRMRRQHRRAEEDRLEERLSRPPDDRTGIYNNTGFKPQYTPGMSARERRMAVLRTPGDVARRKRNEVAIASAFSRRGGGTPL